MSEQLSVTMDAIEQRARKLLPAALFERWFGSLGHPHWITHTNNVAAFEKVLLRPRVLTGVSHPDLATTVVGQPISVPVMLGATGLQGRFHPHAELASARAAAAAGTVFCLSTGASRSIEEVAEAAPGGTNWFQLYFFRDRGITESLVRRAEASGYRAIVITVDNPAIPTHERDDISMLVSRLPRQPSDLASNNSPFGTTPQFANVEEQLAAYEPNITWEAIDRVRAWTPLPIILKGIQTAEDAHLAIEHGAAAIVVSNHGGHALAGARATLEQLPAIVEAVAGRIEVYVDGGIRRGSDVLKALGLGARAVLIGRGQYWGLATGGETGVRTVLEMLREEMRLAAIFCGLADVKQADRSLVLDPPPTAARPVVGDGRPSRVTRQAAAQPGRPLDPALFSGPAFAHTLFGAEGVDRVAVNLVRQAPGTRSHWHAHPGGQLLYIVEGSGFVQARGGPRLAIAAGDAISAAPGEEHWHGAGSDSELAYLAISLGTATFREPSPAPD